MAYRSRRRSRSGKRVNRRRTYRSSTRRSTRTRRGGSRQQTVRIVVEQPQVTRAGIDPTTGVMSMPAAPAKAMF